MTEISRFKTPNYGAEKFVQVYIDGEAYFSCSEYFHKIILKKILDSFSINPELIKDEVGDIMPAPIGDRYSAVGMGMIKEGENDKEYFLSGKSEDYVLTPNQKHLNDLEKYIPEGIKFKIEKF